MENPHDVVPYFENDGGFIRRVTKRDAYKQGHESRDAEVEVLTAEKLQCRSVVDDLTKSLGEQDAMNTEKDAAIAELVEALSRYVVCCGNTAYLVDREAVQRAYAMAKPALAKHT